MGMLFNNWLRRTRDLQENVYFINYEEMEGDKPQNIRKFVEYLRWNMLAVDDELAEMRQAISWKPWQHDAPYADREEVIKEAVDVLHFVANIIVAAGGTDEMLDKFYIEKMERNKERQIKGYKVKDQGVKCELCTRAIDDVGRSRSIGICVKCLPDEIGGDNYHA